MSAVYLTLSRQVRMKPDTNAHASDTNTDAFRWRQLFANAPRPMWIVDTSTLRFLAVNDAAVATYGWSREEFHQLTLADIRLPEDAAPASSDVINAATAFKRSGIWRHRWRNGTLRYVDITSHEIVWDDKKARLVLVEDITERREAEERMWVLNEQLRAQAALLDLATDAIVVHDLDGHVSFWNSSAARLFGFTAEEAKGRTIEELMGVLVSDFKQVIPEVIAGGQKRTELRARDRNGADLTIDTRITLMRTADGSPHAVLAVITDVTAQRKLEAQMLRAQRLESIGTLAGGIAHDLNNMLSPIMMSIQLLSEEVGEEGRDLLETIERSARRGADLVRQVLAFARGIEGERTLVAIASVVREAERLLRETLPRDIKLEVNIDSSIPDILGDITQLHQVLLNLCVNARDAMPNGGSLQISATIVQLDSQFAMMAQDGKAGAYVCLEVADTGTGIPQHVLDRIFDPFFTTKPVGVGTGLGLATVQSITRSHGGFVNVYSELGKGTTFRIYLPTSETAHEQVLETPEISSLPRGAGELILVADDEAAIRAITKQTLEVFGYQVLLAADGEEALALYKSRRTEIAAVLTDMMMPNLDGPGLIKEIRSIAPKAQIIAASGLGANGNVAKAAGYGVTHFLPKPYTAEILLTTIAAALKAPQ